MDGRRNSVEVILREELAKNFLDVKSVKLEIEGVITLTLAIVSAYAAQVDCDMKEKKNFWNDWEEEMETVPKEESLDWSRFHRVW